MLFLPAQSTSALSCAELLTREAAYEKYDGVIVGHVEDVVQTGQNNQIHITVVRSFKTITEPSLVIDENLTWGAMNGPSEKGSYYLFFLRQQDDGKWENPLCSPSVMIADASVHLEFLEAKEISIAPPPSPASSPAPDSAPADDAGSEDDAGPEDTSWQWQKLLTAAGIGIVGLIAGYTLLRYIKQNR